MHPFERGIAGHANVSHYGGRKMARKRRSDESQPSAAAEQKGDVLLYRVNAVCLMWTPHMCYVWLL
jgi:hypothetical protein